VNIIQIVRRRFEKVEAPDPEAELDSALANLRVLFQESPAYHAAYLKAWPKNSPLHQIYDPRIIDRDL
jgi:hypothetical protein